MTLETTSAKSNAELVRWSIEHLNTHDVSVFEEELWTDETVERFPDRTCRGPAEIGRYFRDLFSAVPDLRMEVVALAADGENVIARWHMTGTHTGPLFGLEPTGRPLAIDGIDHFVVRDGKVVSNFVVVDQMQYARQLGVLPPDGSLADRAMKAAFNARVRLARRLRR